MEGRDPSMTDRSSRETGHSVAEPAPPEGRKPLAIPPSRAHPRLDESDPNLKEVP